MHERSYAFMHLSERKKPSEVGILGGLYLELYPFISSPQQY